MYRGCQFQSSMSRVADLLPLSTPVLPVDLQMALLLAGLCKTKAGPPGRPSSLCLSSPPTASRLSFAWDIAPSNGAEISSHTAQIWLASTLSSYPKQLASTPRFEMRISTSEDPLLVIDSSQSIVFIISVVPLTESHACQTTACYRNIAQSETVTSALL